MGGTRTLHVVKTAHTLIWAFFASCVVAIPLVAWAGQLDRALFLVGIVGVEVLVLAFNGWRCPLTAVAARYTNDRQDNFDIYLPVWLARHNKTIFGALLIGGMVFTAARWLGGV